MRHIKNNSCSFLNVSWSYPTKFDKLIFKRLCSVLCQTVDSESNLRYFWSFSLIDNALSFLLKTCLWIKKNLAPSIMAPEVNQKSLVNWFLVDFGDSESNLKLVLRYSAVESASLFFFFKLVLELERVTSKWFSYSELTSRLFWVTLCLIVLIGFLLKLVLKLERVNSK